MRAAAGLTIERVAQRLECSDSKISRIENGDTAATPRDVGDMLDLYDVDDSKREELLQLARQGRRRSALEIEFHDLPHTYYSYESAAVAIRMYQVLVLPGLLQTEDYARALLLALRPSLDPPDVEGRVEFRMKQQQALLTRPKPPSLHVVLDEAVLRRPIGSAMTMRQQFKQLIEWTASPNVAVQVLPFAAGAHAGMNGAFTILVSDPSAKLDVVYLETTANDFLLDEADVVARYGRVFEHACEQALGPEESRAFIGKASQGL